MTDYSTAFKANMVRKLLSPGAPTVLSLSTQSGIGRSTLSRWLRDAKDGGVKLSSKALVKVPRRPGDWKPEEKLQLVFEGDGLRGDALGELLRREGVHETDLTEWRRAVLAALGPSSKAQPGSSEARRVRELERELLRKDKALAETAALLVLKKKVHEYWGDEDDFTKRETEK
jgi:transposase-like protein